MKKIIIGIVCLLTIGKAFAQLDHPVKWGYASKRISKNVAEVFLKATIEDGWHIYSAYQEPGGPVKTSVEFATSKNYSLDGKLTEPEPVSRFEKAFNMKVSFFENSVIFSQKMKLIAATSVVKGKLTFMVCNDRKCLPPEDIAFAIPVK